MSCATGYALKGYSCPYKYSVSSLLCEYLFWLFYSIPRKQQGKQMNLKRIPFQIHNEKRQRSLSSSRCAFIYKKIPL